MKTEAELLQDWQAYQPTLTRQADFDAYWKGNFDLSRSVPLEERRIKAGESAIAEHFHVYYQGCDASAIHGILILPKQRPGRIPVLVSYHGCMGSCGGFADYDDFVLAGYAVFSLDIRGQGGISENRYPYSKGTGVLNGGAHNKDEYYLKWQVLDCIRALDVACGWPFADTRLLPVHGVSQGGGIAVTMCGLDKRVTHCLCDVPSSSDIVHRMEGRHGMFNALNEFIEAYPECREDVLRTVSYFDTMNMAAGITAEIFASVGGEDTVCPPRMFFATYNRIPSKKQIAVYPGAGHEGGGAEHHRKKVAYLKSIR